MVDRVSSPGTILFGTNVENQLSRRRIARIGLIYEQLRITVGVLGI